MPHRFRQALAASLPAFAISLAAGIAPANAQAPLSAGEMRVLAEDIARSYLQVWSQGGAAAIADVDDVYGDRVSFYGRTVGRRDLAAIKRAFSRRWPLRRYVIRPGTMRTRCEEARQACFVSAIMDFEAASPVRRKHARGTAAFKLGIGFRGPQPVVLYENGRVLSRR